VEMYKIMNSRDKNKHFPQNNVRKWSSVKLRQIHLIQAKTGKSSHR
jgi:hypothetical protein